MRWLFLLWFCLIHGSALSQAWPTRPIRLVVGFAPGGAADFVARALEQPLSRALGQPLVIDYRPGAGSSIAAEHVARSAPDGYTVLIASASSILVNPLLTKGSFQPMKELAAVTRVSTSPLLLAVNPALNVANLKELVLYAKQNPGKLNYSSSGNGSMPHMAAVLFVRSAGVEMVHVPYKGGGPSVQSLLAGDTHLSFATPPSVLPLVQAGRLRALAVTSRERTPVVPGVPGMAEAGLPDYEISLWYGFFLPAGTPAATIKRLFEDTRQVLALPEISTTLARQITEASGSKSPEDFTAFLEREAILWSRLVRESGAKAE